MSVVATRPRLGFVGVGFIGRKRMDAIVEAGAGEVAAIADPALPDAYDSLDELLELDLDGIVIATPSALHAEQATAALERGLAVFCQKPLATTAAETAQVVEAARAADALLAVDFSYRWVTGMRRASELVRAREIGEVFAADLVFHNAYGPQGEWWYDPVLSGGGCVLDLGVHLVDMALWTLEFPEVLDVTSHVWGAGLVEEYAHAHLELETGASVRVACSWNLHAGQDAVIEMTFYGDEGAVTTRNVGGSFVDFRTERFRGTAREVLVEPPDAWGGRATVDWARRLAAGERFDARACDEAVAVADVLDRIYGR